MRWFKSKRGESRPALPLRIPRVRVSVDESADYGSLLQVAQGRLATVDPQVPLPFYDIIEKLCLVNPDFSQALNNTIRLGNPGHELSVTAGSEAAMQAALERLNRLAVKLNTDQLINRLIRQAAVGGAVSLEWVAAADLSGIEKAALVPVKSIRFRYDRKADRYIPLQQLGRANRQVELNELTYFYSALESSDNSPYGIPPFLAALGNAVIQLFMMENLKFMSRKFGLLGFEDVTVEPPVKKPGETDEAYRRRVTDYLNAFAADFSDNYRDGVVAHLDNIEINHHDLTGDARGAKEVLQMNEEQIASGLKTDPALLGRSYSTTETYAGVVYAMLIKQIENVQRLVKRAVEKGGT